MLNRKGPMFHCPVCGLELRVSAARTHPGSARCIMTLHRRRGGVYFDPAKAPTILAYGEILEDLTRGSRLQPAGGGDDQ